MSLGRILAVDDDALVLRTLEEGLTALGAEVLAIKEGTLTVPRARSFKPDLVLIDRVMPVLHGAEIARALRAFADTARIPVAFLTADGSASALVHSVRAGAVDVLFKPLTDAVFSRIAALMKELHAQEHDGVTTPEQQVRTLLQIVARAQMEGVLRVNAGTPFEGRAVFEGGELQTAEFGPATGMDALEEMISFDGGLWRFDDGVPEETTGRIVAPASSEEAPEVPAPGKLALRILLVDDDEALRNLFQLQLRRAGFHVELAEDGREGVQLARSRDFDLVVADLNMPRLDGWGMLRELRADFRTRELPVIFLSAHDDYRETLRAAKSGAWDYLPKTGRADQVISGTLKALLPRQRAVADLLVGQPAGVDLGVVGPRWYLRALAAHKATGVLEVKDAWASYSFTVKHGAPVAAHALCGKRKSTGMAAVGALIVSRGARGDFLPGAPDEPPMFSDGMDRVVDAACAALNELEGRALSQKLERGGTLEVDAELYELYRRISSDRDLQVARAVCEEKVPATRLPDHLSMPREDIEAALADLLRRRVIRIVA